MNICLQEADVPEWMTKRKTTLIQKDLLKRTAPKQLQTHDRTIYNVENTSGTNKVRDLWLANKLQKQKEWSRGSRGPGEQLYIDQHILNECKMRRKKFSYGIDWPQKAICWYKQPQNVQDIKRNYKLYQESHEKLESGIDSWSEKLCSNEDPERYTPGRCTITITVRNNDDATQTNTQEMHK